MPFNVIFPNWCILHLSKLLVTKRNGISQFSRIQLFVLDNMDTMRFSWAMVHVSSQSRAQDELTCQQKKRQQTPGVPDNSRTIHAVLNNNNNRTTPRCATQTCIIHTVRTKNSHMWTQMEKNRNTLKQSVATRKISPPKTWISALLLGVNTTCSSPDSALEVGDQLQPHCIPFFRRHTQQFLCSPGKPWSVTCGVLLLWDILCLTICAHCSTFVLKHSTAPQRCLPTPTAVLAHGRTPNQHHTTANPPTATLATNVETESVVFATPIVMFPTRFEQHPSTITSSFARYDRIWSVSPDHNQLGELCHAQHLNLHRLSSWHHRWATWREGFPARRVWLWDLENNLIRSRRSNSLSTELSDTICWFTLHVSIVWTAQHQQMSTCMSTNNDCHGRFGRLRFPFGHGSSYSPFKNTSWRLNLVTLISSLLSSNFLTTSHRT